jgi:hypothetical protein
MRLDAKTVLVHPAGHVARDWQVKLPAGVSFGDIFRPSTWTEIEKYMRQRGGNKRPTKDELIRIIGAGFDVTCVVQSVSDGYRLRFYSGIRPAPLPLILADLDALPEASTAAEVKARASALRKKWAAAGVSREDIAGARRAFAKANHPDTGSADGKRLASANSLLDYALEEAA